MADARAMLRLTDELLWVLRRAGFVIPTSAAIDAVRALDAVGFGSRDVVRDALAAVIVKRREERARFDATVDAFFSRTKRSDLWERLAEAGLSEVERAEVRELLSAYAQASPQGTLGALVMRGQELDRLLQLARITRTLEGLQSPLQVGFFTHKLLAAAGTWQAKRELSAFRARLTDAFGSERAAVILEALTRELELASEELRGFVAGTLARREDEAGERQDLDAIQVAALDEPGAREVRRAVRAFVQRLRGGERVRRRRARRGKIDVHRTLRLAMRTGGVPFVLGRRARRRDKPKLFILCDVSESVREVSRFTLELTYAAQELFSGTRSFVFVSELGETTDLFAAHDVEAAIARAYAGAVVPVMHNSNYGRVLRAFRERYLSAVDRRTTVVIVGDGRTNYQDAAASVLDAITARARALVWLCPEPPSAWASGDSAMQRYAPKCTKVLPVRSARELEAAARLLATLR